MEKVISKLKQQIEEQKTKNMALYKIFQYSMHLKENEPVINEWRKGMVEIRELRQRLFELEQKQTKVEKQATQPIQKTFVNSYGEATQRHITCSTYERQQKKLNKQMEHFLHK